MTLTSKHLVQGHKYVKYICFKNVVLVQNEN